MPRTAQHERTAIHIYQPAWDETTDALLWSVYPYRLYTHAYFPTEHFGEVRQVDNWTLGAKDGAYIALWSNRPAVWGPVAEGAAAEFDLVAAAGPENVWITEVGSDEYSSLDDFVAAVTAEAPVVEGSGPTSTVRWASPSAGEISFGWEEPLVVAGATQSIADFDRHESPWGTIERLETTHGWEADGAVLELDFDANERRLT